MANRTPADVNVVLINRPGIEPSGAGEPSIPGPTEAKANE